MTKADELWAKYKQPGKFDGFTGDIVCKLDFLAALKEYGAMVRKEDAETARTHTFGSPVCAAAISDTPLP